MSDRRPSEHGEQLPMPRSAAGTLRPEDLGAHGPVTAPYVWRRGDLVVATKMLDHGFDSRELDLLRVARWAHDLGKQSWSVEATSYTPLSGEELTRSLLRTAEGAAGLPCASSGVLHGLAPVITGGTELSSLRRVIAHLGAGKTASLVAALMGQLHRDVHEALHDGLGPTESKRISDTATTLSALLVDIVQRRLNGSVKHFVELLVVPLSESSPCGLLRLAAPRVPRAPGAGLILSPSKFALVA
ncbi:hypothetical protein ACH4LT_07410 [Streptomyces clavifer]|uniref:hypothetical protein n=1 Tax=Streptomyces clavifer TaxID=68188 RepID=UPI00379B8D45